MDELISRRSAIDGLDRHRVEHRHLNDWQVGWNEALDWVQDIYLEDLPSEQPERKMGKWVSRENELKHRDWVSCSRCTGIFDYRWKFCPNCGAKMEE